MIYSKYFFDYDNNMELFIGFQNSLSFKERLSDLVFNTTIAPDNNVLEQCKVN